ncbi:MAG: glycosyltransferase family 4 protein, partial [Actinocatenispora sp.]
MKVVIAHNLYSSAQPSGENQIVESESRMLAEAGVEVLPLLRSSDEIEEMSAARKATLPLSPIYARDAQRTLTELIRRERPDVLHLHNPYPLLSPWVVRTAHRHGVPVVQTVHNYRHVCADSTYYRQGHPCHDCLGKRFPYPAVRHSCYRGSRAQSVVMATTLAVHRPTWRSVDRFIALAPHIADHLASFGITDEQITVKPNGIPDPGAHDERGDGFLFFGRLVDAKGVGLLLDAWERHADGDLGTLRIVGDGPLRARVEVAAATRADVEYLGLLDHEAALRAVRAAAVVVAPSTYADALPTV